MMFFFDAAFLLLMTLLFEPKQATNITLVAQKSSKDKWSAFSSSVDYCSGQGTFPCTETGRFRNPNDLNCKSYYYCYEWSNGTVGQYHYTCAVGLFNPNTHSCDPDYDCPCTAVSTASSISPGYCSADETFNCTETGRFRNPGDLSCKSYYYCYKWSNGIVRQYDYTCAVGLFNPDTHSCDPNYVCPCSESSAASTISTVSPAYCSGNEVFSCKQTGRYRNPRDLSCKSYYYCYKWSNGTVGQYHYTCAVGLFNPNTHSCDPDYDCPCTAVSTASSISPGYCSADETFSCTETGRFRNPGDLSCKSYYYCYKWSDGTVRQYDYTCAVGLFNPDTQSCDSNYVCPCTGSTAVSTVSTTTPNSCSEDEIFICTVTGRFRDPKDLTCASYIFCYQWSNGTMGQYNYTCEVGLFNPDTHSCDPTYVCPCTESTSASTTSSTTELTTTSTVPTTTSSTTKLTTTSTISTSSTTEATTTATVPTTSSTTEATTTSRPTTSSTTEATTTATVPTTSSTTEATTTSRPTTSSTTEATTTATVPTTSSTTQATTTSRPTTSSTTEATTTSTESTTSSTTEVTTILPTTPDYCNINQTFTCERTGLFRNPRDVTCLFNPDKHRCDLSYHCPC